MDFNHDVMQCEGQAGTTRTTRGVLPVKSAAAPPCFAKAQRSPHSEPTKPEAS